MKMPFCLSGSWPCHFDVWSLLLVLVQFLQSGLELQAIPNTVNLLIWYRGSLSFLRITISLLTSDVHLAPFAIFTMLLSEQWSAWNLSHSLICDRSTEAASWFTRTSLWWIVNVLYFHRFECRPRNNAESSSYFLFILHNCILKCSAWSISSQNLHVNIAQASSRYFCTFSGVHLWYIQLVGYYLKRHVPVSVRFYSWQSTSEQKQSHEGEGTDCRA